MEQYFHIYLIYVYLDQIPLNFNYETMIHLTFLLTKINIINYIL